MKHPIIALLLCATLLLGISGCAPSQADSAVCSFYYSRLEPDYTSDHPLICPEARDLRGLRGLEEYLNAYFAGPLDPSLQLPFPRDTKLMGWSLQDGTLALDFSEEFSLLSGSDLSVACGCIAQTFLELTGADQVIITAGGSMLGGESAVTMTRDTLLLRDDSLDRLTSEYTIYYTDKDRRYLISQTISVNLASLDSVETYLVEQLLTGTPDAGLTAPLPPGTRLLDIEVEDKLCTVHFSREFEANCSGDPMAQRLALMSVVNTLTQLESIERVEFVIDGDLLLHYGLLRISEPLQFDETAIGPVRTAVGEFDATLYLANGEDHLLLGIPTRIRQSAGVSHAELVIQALLQYEPKNGLSAGNSGGVTLNGIYVADGICSVDLSASADSVPGQLPQLARSLTASLCDLEGIRGVQIRLDGNIPEDAEGVWGTVLTPESDWFL